MRAVRLWQLLCGGEVWADEMGRYCVFYKEENCRGEMVRWVDGKRVESGGSE
jgi:hypothetical protein